MIATIMRVLSNQNGATAIEYALIGALISIAAVSVISTVGLNVSTLFNTVATKL